MTLENVFYSMGILLMVLWIIAVIGVIVLGFTFYKKMKQLERTAQLKLDHFQQQFAHSGRDKRVFAMKFLPMISFVMPLLFRALRKWKR